MLCQTFLSCLPLFLKTGMARFRNFYTQLLCIFIEGKIKAIQLVNARVTVQTVLFTLLSFFSVFIFSTPSKVILIVIEFMFLGINMFWALLRLILALT